jgi:hypothetical protein
MRRRPLIVCYVENLFNLLKKLAHKKTAWGGGKCPKKFSNAR